MARLIVKSPYIKSGGSGRGADGYLSYIGTRERVEILPDDRPPTRKQEQLIKKLVADFPDTKTCDEYMDYVEQPSKARASVLISAAVESHWDHVRNSDAYMKYIATRPRVERLGTHGLFGDEEHVGLNAVMGDLQNYTGNVWTHIISLSREDAVRYGYDHAEAWRNLLLTHRNEIAAAMKIPANNFRWYAAFHNEGHHPHVHMMAWSTKPGQAYLSKDGITKIKSVLANDIFKHEMVEVLEQKSTSRDSLMRETRDALTELLREMRHGIADHPDMEEKIIALSAELQNVGGKHKYGYLKKPLKKKVDEIVDALEELPVVSECYDRWLELQNQVDEFYKDEKRKRVRLSGQKEFRAIKNAVIQVADQLRSGEMTFEDQDARRLDEQDDSDIYASDQYWMLKNVIADESLTLAERKAAATELESLAETGDAHAQYFIGKLYRDGDVLIPDSVNAQYWFSKAAQQGLVHAQYALGKLLLTSDVEVHDVDAGLRWLELAAQNSSNYAAYRLGKEYLKSGRKDVQKAVRYFEQAANAGNQFAQYALGKLLLAEDDVKQNVDHAMEYLEQSAAQGNEFAQFLVDRQDSLQHPKVMLAATKLMRQMGRIFQENSLPQTGPRFAPIGRKRMQELIDRMGYKAAKSYAQAQEEEQEYNGPTMSAPW